MFSSSVAVLEKLGEYAEHGGPRPVGGELIIFAFEA